MRSARTSQPFASRQRGLTLIELVVTIALVALLVTISIQSFVTWIRNAQIRTVTESLQGGLRTAQAEAVRRNRQVVLYFTNDEPSSGVTGTTKCSSAAPVVGGKRWVLQTIPGLWGEETSGCKNAEYITGGKLSDIASAVSIEPIPSSVSAVCFNASGRMATTATGSAGTGISAACTAAVTTFNVTLLNADRPLRVVSQLGGQIRMCDPKRPAVSATSPDGC